MVSVAVVNCVFAGVDTDVDFDPTADMLIHDYDDERTMDEEEAMSNEESVANELDDLQKVRIFMSFVTCQTPYCCHLFTSSTLCYKIIVVSIAFIMCCGFSCSPMPNPNSHNSLYSLTPVPVTTNIVHKNQCDMSCSFFSFSFHFCIDCMVHHNKNCTISNLLFVTIILSGFISATFNDIQCTRMYKCGKLFSQCDT